MWENIVQPDRPQMTIWRMRIAFWMPKATNTRSHYVLPIVVHCKMVAGTHFNVMSYCLPVTSDIKVPSLWVFYHAHLTRFVRTAKSVGQFPELLVKPAAYQGGLVGFKPPPPRNSEGPPQNRAKINPIVKTVKNCWIWEAKNPRCSERGQ